MQVDGKVRGTVSLARDASEDDARAAAMAVANVTKYLEGRAPSLEADALEHLAADRELAAYKHDEFWQCMDTLRDVRLLESLWQGGRPPWKTWD